MILKIKKLHPSAMMPKYGHYGDAGFDLCVVKDTLVGKGEWFLVPTGIAMEIPDGYVGLIWDKSGVSIKHGIKTIGGVIDSTYRGEVFVAVVNLRDKNHLFEKGDKIAQMIIQKKEIVEFLEVDKLSETTRGSGGFGSTGK